MICLDNIIGLSETECECFDPKPAGYNTSASGIWLDQLEGFNLKVAAGADDCASGGLWERMDRAVRNAKVDLRKDLLGCIGKEYKPRAEFFKGQLGEATFKNPLTLPNSYAGIKVSPFQIKGGVIVLKRIGILINAAVPVTVKVFSTENGGTEIASYTTPVAVTANQLTWLSITPNPLELPMWNYSHRVDYYVLLILNNAVFKPNNNKKDCGCGGVQRPYLNWLDFAGTTGNDVTNLSTFQTTKEINGLVLDVEVKCQVSDLICDNERPLDFENDSFAQYLAYAVRFKAAERLYRELISTDQINRYSMMGGELHNTLIGSWGAAYLDCVQYLCSIINVDNNDCLVCRDSRTIYKGKIKA